VLTGFVALAVVQRQTEAVILTSTEFQRLLVTIQSDRSAAQQAKCRRIANRGIY
jgi:hypothetical protein